MKKRNTKASLISSAMALLLCFAMLLGTTYAWFTDSVTSEGNTIQSGTLKIDLSHKVGDVWTSLKKNPEHKVFNYDKWEPGYTRVEALKVDNLGSLALQYKLSLSIAPGSEILGDNGENLADVIQVYYKNAEATPANYAAIKDAWTYAGTLSNVMNSPATFIGGQLTPDGEQGSEQIFTIALHMDETAGNEYQNLSVGNIYVNLIATQWTYEDDAFGKDYDNDAVFPVTAPGVLFYASAPVTVVEGKVESEVSIGNQGDKSTAVVPAGVEMEDGATELTLGISVVEDREADVDMNGGDVAVPLDVHMEGVSKDNTVPILIAIHDVFPKNYATYNIKLYHVENGTTVAMTAVDSLEALDAHNEYYYDPATGTVTLSMATFSEVTATVANGNPWDGTDVDTSWYNTTDTEFTLADAADFAGFAQIVGGMAAGIARDNFAGKTVKLGVDINLGGNNGVVWYPVGYYNNTGSYEHTSGGNVTSDVYSFEGIFDGQGYTISDIYQNTWDMFGDYNSGYSGTPNYYKDGMGVFGWVHNGTVKNLAVVNFQSDGEFCTTGCVAAYSSGVSTFDNIRITNCNPRAYNVPNGGVVGYAYDEETAEANSITFNNISIDPTTKISALWGSWDVGCGGILGRSGDNTAVKMTNCSVGAIMDVFNDVCANYQYYDFRYAGMLIGTVGSDGDPSDQNISFENVQVYYGDWSNDYHYYCELVENSIASYTHDYQFSRLDKINAVSEIQDLNGNWNKTGDFVIVDEDTTNCYHIRMNADGTYYQYEHENSGTETIDGVEVLVEDKQCVHIPFRQLYTGYGWGATATAEGANVSEAKYTITFMTNDGNRVLDVQYITVSEAITITECDDIAEKLLIKIDSSYESEFDGWITAGAVKPTTIEADNTKNYVLYPTLKEKYTARWLDENGDTYHTETFSKGATAFTTTPPEPTSTCEYLEFSHWEVKVGDQYVALTEYNLADATGDISIYPYFNVKQAEGMVGLTPGPDEDGDGRPDSYSVEAVSGLSGEVVIPGSVNGAPVTVITDLSDDFVNGWGSEGISSIIIKDGVQEIGSEAFAMTSNLKTVTIPASVTSIGANAFANGIGGGIVDAFGGGKVVTITYAGTWNQWLEICDSGWDSGLAMNSTVICQGDGSTYVKTGRAWESGLNYWQKQQ